MCGLLVRKCIATSIASVYTMCGLLVRKCIVTSIASVYTEAEIYDDIIKWKHFPRYWPFVRGITGITKPSDAEL